MEPTTQGPSGNTSTATKPTTYTLPLVHTDCRALLRATQIKTEARESALRRLRPLRSSAKYQRRYLDGTIKRFVRLVEAGLEGEHFHRDLYDFFADDENRLSTSIVETPESVAPRLRTRRRNRDYEQSDPQSPSDEQNTLTSCGLFVAYLETVVSQYDLMSARDKGVGDDLLAAAEAVARVEAYYQVRLNTLLGNVAMLVVEACLLHDLPSIIHEDLIYDLSDEQILRLAAEPADATEQRERLQEQMQVLWEATKTFQRYAHTEREPQTASLPSRPRGSTNQPLPYDDVDGTAPSHDSRWTHFESTAQSNSSNPTGEHFGVFHRDSSRSRGGLFRVNRGNSGSARGGLFGGTRSNNSGVGLFSPSNPQRNAPSLFGGAPAKSNSGGLFGPSNHASGSDARISLGSTRNAPQSGAFRANSAGFGANSGFRATNSNITTGGFGQPGGSTGWRGFGSTPANTGFGGFGQPQPKPSPFGRWERRV
ncbi:hypothetical protein DOTSEDRAFT_53453 [Dothistroma septosporum NZE10]|uniref:GED domain-containing protein n=1 Tax=Dothistroma septosporum (strain NZE10 / CBS 128990) TaxID=675120 RepID=N1PN16_DOTSN|nr:hypothetical protein DOTSEDRAFT_53453 [Dothistroma septosporum NZE10]